LSVKLNGKTLRGFSSKRIGVANDKQFKARLIGLPVGGPYDLTLRLVNQTTTAHNVLVGDVWILAGQSNMQGCGRWIHREPPHQFVRAEYFDNRWDVAEDPLHNLWDATDPIHHRLSGQERYPPPPKLAKNRLGVGPGVAMGKAMYQTTGVPQGFIACAHGATSMSQWDPKQKRPADDSLYGAMIRRLKRNGGQAGGLVWYQGESDALSGKVNSYTQRTQNLIRSLRQDTDSPNLPVTLVQLGRCATPLLSEASCWWNQIQEQQRQLPKTIHGVTTVSTIDLRLDDKIHIAAEDQHRLGKRIATSMLAFQGDHNHGRLSIQLKKITFKKRASSNIHQVIAEFDHVDGQLRSGDRPTGFALTGSPPPSLVDVQLDGNRAILWVQMDLAYATNFALHYGRGLDPVCNITDQADRALPAFGPVLITPPCAMTPFVNQWRVSDLLPADQSFQQWTCPKPTQVRKWPTQQFTTELADRGPSTAPRTQEDGILYFSCTIHCNSRMKLNAHLGYAGPVKMWCDETLVYQDESGATPALFEKGLISLQRKTGPRNIVIGLNTDGRRAWAISLRFERMDLRPSQIIRGRATLPLVTAS